MYCRSSDVYDSLFSPLSLDMATPSSPPSSTPSSLIEVMAEDPRVREGDVGSVVGKVDGSGVLCDC